MTAKRASAGAFLKYLSSIEPGQHIVTGQWGSEENVKLKFVEVWPHGRGIQTWDAVGRIKRGSAEEWLLVEAKAHIGELKSNCKADGGLERIRQTVDATKAALGVPTH